MKEPMLNIYGKIMAFITTINLESTINVVNVPKKTVIVKKQIERLENAFYEFGTENSRKMSYTERFDLVLMKTVDGNIVASCYVEFIESYFYSEDKEQKRLKIYGKYKKYKLYRQENTPKTKYRAVSIFSLVVYPEFRRKGYSKKMLDIIYEKYKPDIFCLAVNPKDTFSTINLYNYFKIGFIHISFCRGNPRSIFKKTYAEFLASRVDSTNGLEEIEQKVKKNTGANKYLILSHSNYGNHIPPQIDKSKVMSSAENIIDLMLRRLK